MTKPVRNLKACKAVLEAHDASHGVNVIIQAFEARHPDARQRVRRVISHHDGMAVSLESLAAGREITGRASKRLDKSAARHRAMAKAFRAVARTYKNRNLSEGDPDSPGPTAEMLAHCRHGNKIDPLRRMYEKEQINDEQLRAGHEVASIVRFITAGLGFSTMKFGREPKGAPNIDAIERMADLHALIYVPWCEMMKRGVTLDFGPVDHTDLSKGRKLRRIEAALPLMMGLLVEGEGIEALRKRYKLRRSTVYLTIRESLDRYDSIRSDHLRG